MSDPVKVIVCRVGEEPAWEVLQPSRNGHLNAMQRVVGGMVEVVHLADPAVPGLELWCNEEGMLIGLPINRVFGATPRRTPAGFEDAFVIDTTGGAGARPGEPGEWRIRGDLFLARSDDEGELVDATDADMAWARATFRGANLAAAEAMEHIRQRMRRGGTL